MGGWRQTVLTLLIGILAVLPPGLRAERLLPVFDFASVEEARGAWVPGSGVAPVELYAGDPGLENPGLRFPCNFTDVTSRCFWDTSISEDFTDYSLVTMRIYVEDPIPVSSITLYFRSGSGWFHHTFGNLRAGWQELRAGRADFGLSGTPAGWDAIDGIRFSPWKAPGTDADTEIIANELRLSNPQILVVRGTKSTAQDTAASTTDLISRCLDAWEIDFGVITEEDVEDGALTGAQLAIFPYSNNMSAEEIAEIEGFVESGGRIIIFFTAPTEVFSLLGLQNLGSSGIAPRAMRFQSDLGGCLPPVIGQASWNFFRVNLVGPDVEVLAEWEDAEGTALGWPAWTMGNNGAYMSHILLGDDLENKKRLMLALVAHFVPAAGDEVAETAVRGMGRIGTYLEFDEAVEGIRALSLRTPRAGIVEDYLTSATLLRAAAVESVSEGTLCGTVETVAEVRRHLSEAYYRAQSPKLPEFRASWASYSNTSGPFVEGWDKLAIDLSSNGFHAVMPYMATGGVAHYESEFLPHSDVVDLYGDHIAACVEACKPRGIETHVRKLNFFLLGSPQSFIDDMRAQVRTQVDVHGEPVDWLCPSHPLNFQLEVDVMLEIVDNYDIDGIHYDFIRYPGELTCYCEGCHERFQQQTGHTVTDWPADCYSGALKEPYREWRREQITRVVRTMREALDERESEVKISAAVFSNYPAILTSIGQDWVSWVEHGYLDFVVPMSYTNSAHRFESLLQSHQHFVDGRVPLYPGIGVASSSSNLPADQTIVQILITRQYEAGGFVTFNYGHYLAEEILPNLRKGLTADPELSGFWLH